MVGGVRRYVDEVRSRHFPEPDHVYGVEPAELAQLRRYLEQESLTSAKVGLGAVVVGLKQSSETVSRSLRSCGLGAGIGCLLNLLHPRI